ncbi:uncharacterized protein LOC106650733 [Trichogramma pretiosum]|uniref:uncharacterized protein LOC106650733 n=1 Tax=Trichogramma pretiosum TaxID=7493 RepID=UPI0006C9CD8A|nr:uncharacterized protein LOC106650733 [Trichogramma pretiosum]
MDECPSLDHPAGKYMRQVPDGLHELSSDIAREVIRYQPDDIYSFVADYLASLLITRENAKVAMKVVNNVVMKSEHIIDILCGTGLKLKEISAVAPRLQQAFRVYLNAMEDGKLDCGCDDEVLSEQTEVSLYDILMHTGATKRQAEKAAVKIQALFRGHRERIVLAEQLGKVTWQKAATDTMEILRGTGVTISEAHLAATIIQTAYRGYYTRKKLRAARAAQYIDPEKWLQQMWEQKGVTLEMANEAATVLQRAYRSYRERKLSGMSYLVPQYDQQINQMFGAHIDDFPSRSDIDYYGEYGSVTTFNFSMGEPDKLPVDDMNAKPSSFRDGLDDFDQAEDSGDINDEENNDDVGAADE